MQSGHCWNRIITVTKAKPTGSAIMSSDSIWSCASLPPCDIISHQRHQHGIVKADKAAGGRFQEQRGGRRRAKCATVTARTRTHGKPATLTVAYSYAVETHVCKMSCYTPVKTLARACTRLIVHIHEHTYRMFRFARLALIVSPVCAVISLACALACTCENVRPHLA